MALPILLAGAVVLRRGGDAVTRAQASMRLCLGVAKWVLLVVPLWRIAMLVLENGPQNVSCGAAWAGLLSVSVCLGLLFTSAGDVSAGLGGWLGVPTLSLRNSNTCRLAVVATHGVSASAALGGSMQYR